MVDLACWQTTTDNAYAVVAAAVQQRIVTVAHLRASLLTAPKARHRGVLLKDLADLEGGAHSLPERALSPALRKAGLPLPTRQAVRSVGGRRRYLDAYWDDYALCVEIDGAAHREAAAWQADMQREREIAISGVLVLRFSAHELRTHPDEVADTIRRALIVRGWSQSRQKRR